jgi:co-chaperonin GroES (HSP10)
MRFKIEQVVPAPGKFLVELDPLEDTTEGGIHIPTLTGADGKPTRGSLADIATAVILATGDAVGSTPAPFQTGDRVILGGSPAMFEIDGKEYGFMAFHIAVGKVTPAS